MEFGPYDIRVNTILPGAVDTPMITEETRAGEGFIGKIPIPRAGRPERQPDAPDHRPLLPELRPVAPHDLPADDLPASR